MSTAGQPSANWPTRGGRRCGGLAEVSPPSELLQFDRVRLGPRQRGRSGCGGFALALGKKFICLARDAQDLPFLLKSAPNVTNNIKLVFFDDQPDLLQMISATRDQMFDFPDP